MSKTPWPPACRPTSWPACRPSASARSWMWPWPAFSTSRRCARSWPARNELQERKVIDRAKGLLMQRQGLTEQAAYEKLRKTAMDKG
jgi:hypothetical protein